MNAVVAGYSMGGSLLSEMVPVPAPSSIFTKALGSSSATTKVSSCSSRASPLTLTVKVPWVSPGLMISVLKSSVPFWLVSLS